MSFGSYACYDRRPVTSGNLQYGSLLERQSARGTTGPVQRSGERSVLRELVLNEQVTAGDNKEWRFRSFCFTFHSLAANGSQIAPVLWSL